MDAACEAADGTVSARPATRRTSLGFALRTWSTMIASPVPVSRKSFSRRYAVCHQFTLAFLSLTQQWPVPPVVRTGSGSLALSRAGHVQSGTMNAAEAKAALAEWKRRSDQDARERDTLIRVAYEAGVNIRQIHLESGVSRTTIYRVLGVDAGGEKES
jgi:hypothetical protein